MNFIRRIGRDEMYIKYVHQLVNVSASLHLRQICAECSLDAPSVAELRRGGANP
jgi:hypothetical protein